MTTTTSPSKPARKTRSKRPPKVYVVALLGQDGPTRYRQCMVELVDGQPAAGRRRGPRRGCGRLIVGTAAPVQITPGQASRPPRPGPPAPKMRASLAAHIGRAARRGVASRDGASRPSGVR